MDNKALFLISAILIGLGATVTFDLWGLFLKKAFRIPPSNICIVGRWIRYMADGTFRHSTILSAPPKRAECLIGWMAHYMIGVTFALVFVAVAGNGWLEQPTPIPAILFGIATVLAPLFIMQPAFGFGLAGSKTPNPAQSRIRSLMNHTAFGVGLYLFGLLVNRLMG
jgi:hypothetical protein